ncbi:MAG: M20/M25/M40 family metallo-hydrolase [Acidobacteria bacterium]|nr:M20/M25/M40 family metallo-hydrolase [Acidobacteriota bacterium]
MVASRAVKNCLAHFQRSRQWINEKHLELCRIPSPTFFEEQRAEWMAAELRTLGWDAKLDRAGNVVAFEDSQREGPFVALTAHLDTVLAPRKSDEIHFGDRGRLFGPGVSDNGAGLSALLAIASCFKTECPNRGETSVVLVANVGEEGEGNLSGMRFLCKQSPLGQRIRSYLILDGPGTGHITCRALASRRYEVMVQGPGGHSWSDHGTGNPVHTLSRAIHLMTEAHYEEALVNGARSSMNFGTVEGGVSVNSIPSSARAKLDLRSEDPARIDVLARELRSCVEHAVDIENTRAFGGKVSARIKEIGSRPGGGLSDDSPVLGYLRAIDNYLGVRSMLDCASTDANIPLSMGLEAVSIGAGGQGGGAHTPEEWFDPDGRDVGLHRVLLTLCLLLA